MTKQHKYSRISINHYNDFSDYLFAAGNLLFIDSVIQTNLIRVVMTEHHSIQHAYDPGLFIAIRVEFSMIQLAPIKESP